MTITIKLRRLKANMPDDGRSIRVVWQDLANPLRTPEGVVIRTDILNEVTGLMFPAYPEFEEMISIPANAVATQAYIDNLILPALENAKRRAQVRAEDLAAKTTIRTFVTALNQSEKIDFEGTVTL